jgi:hypothetical protein
VSKQAHWNVELLAAAVIRDTATRLVFRTLPLIAAAAGVGGSVALGEPNAPAFSYIGFDSCLASPERFNSKLQSNNSGVAWTTIFTSSGGADSYGNATDVVCTCPLRARIGSAFHRISVVRTETV